MRWLLMFLLAAGYGCAGIQKSNELVGFWISGSKPEELQAVEFRHSGRCIFRGRISEEISPYRIEGGKLVLKHVSVRLETNGGFIPQDFESKEREYLVSFEMKNSELTLTDDEGYLTRKTGAVLQLQRATKEEYERMLGEIRKPLPDLRKHWIAGTSPADYQVANFTFQQTAFMGARANLIGWLRHRDGQYGLEVTMRDGVKLDKREFIDFDVDVLTLDKLVIRDRSGGLTGESGAALTFRVATKEEHDQIVGAITQERFAQAKQSEAAAN